MTTATYNKTLSTDEMNKWISSVDCGDNYCVPTTLLAFCPINVQEAPPKPTLFS
jgi:hypothetical protein